MNSILSIFTSRMSLALIACALLPSLVAAQIEVTFQGVDATTGGDYRNGVSTNGPYGSCFSLVSQASPRNLGPEVEVGENFYNVDPEAYDNRCSLDMISGAGISPPNAGGCTVENTFIPDRETGLDNAICITEKGAVTTSPEFFDFRFFRNVGIPGGPVIEDNGYAWSFLEADNDGFNEAFEIVEWSSGTAPTDTAPSQYNACLNTFRAGTFDNELFVFDPLSGIVNIQSGGNATVAYYFLTAALACREQEWELYIDELDGNGEKLVETGTISDFAFGKYLVFDLENIPDGGAVLRLATKDASGDASCGVPGSTPASNSHLSGIFVSGSNACAPVPAVELEKFTNGYDGDGANGTPVPTPPEGPFEANANPVAEVEVGGAVEWTYRVTNTGTDDLRAIVVTDPAATDLGAFIVCPGNGNNIIDELLVGESLDCTATLDGGAQALEIGQPHVVPGCGDNGDARPTYENMGEVAAVGVISGELVQDVDASHYCNPPLKLSLGDFVWEDLNANGAQDAGEPGIEGVLVELLDNDMNPTGAQDTTNAGGNYLFTDLDPGTYFVRFTDPAGFTLTTPNAAGVDDAEDSDAVDEGTGTAKTGPIVLVDENDLTIDAGYLRPVAQIGDFVWEDLNGNGIQDPGEPGIPGVTVQLKDAAGAVIQTTTTDANGEYSFTVEPGTYSVVIGQPDGFEYTTPKAGNDDTVDSDADPAMGGMTDTVTVAEGETNNTLDGGLYQPASLGDFVWEDSNGNGIQDSGESGVPGVTVELLDADMNPIGGGTTTTTDANGVYNFSNLTPGTYFVQFTAPDGRSFTMQGAGTDPTVDSNAGVDGKSGPVELASGENDPTIDAGLVAQASLGDRVWEDENRNGQQDAAEPGIEGVLVELLDSDMNPTGLTDTTDANGLYGFTSLAPGTYFVRFTDPAGLTLTTPNAAGVDDAEDSDAVDEGTGTAKTGPIELAAGENDPTNDAGYFHPVVPNASLGDFVWNDLDADGEQDPGEPGIEGVVVTLLDENMDPTGLTDTTDEDGVYGFASLLPGTYFVLFDNPAGLTLTTANADGVSDAADSDAVDQGNGTAKTGPIELAAGENDPTNDAGYFRPAVIGDFVWEDLNGDGQQDAGEPGVGGVTVKLKDADGLVIAETSTTADGLYQFTVRPGTYSVMFVAPNETAFTTLNVGDDATDSDADPAMDGMTQNVTLASGEANTTLDAGLVRLLPDIDIRKQEEGPDSRIFDAGDTVDFEIEVTNTGSVDLTDVAVSDPLLAACDRIIGNLAIGESVTYICSTVLGGSGSVVKTYKDTFSSISYDNNDGTHDFLGSWFENDKADGYTQSPTKGNVIIGSNKKLWLDDYPNTNTDPSIKRAADLSGLDSATLEFDWKTHPGVDKTDSVVVEISVDGGATWKQLKNFTGFKGTRSGHEKFDISGYISSKTAVRFRVNKYYGGRNETFKVDNFMITGKGKDDAEGFNNEACVSGEGAGATVTDCDTSEVVVDEAPPVCAECVGGLTSMTLKIISGSRDRPDDERIRVREGGLGGFVLYDSFEDGDANPTVPTGGSFTFAIRNSNKPVVVTVQGKNHKRETVKAKFDTDCSVELGDVDGNNYIKFEVTAATTLDFVPICPVEPSVGQCVEIKNKKYGHYLKGKSDDKVWMTSKRGDDTKWILEEDGQDRYLIRSAKFDKTIDGNNHGYRVELDATPEDDDLWIFKDLGRDIFSLKNKVTGRYMDGERDGSVETSSSSSGKDKKWKISYLDPRKCESVSHSPKPRPRGSDDD